MKRIVTLVLCILIVIGSDSSYVILHGQTPKINVSSSAITTDIIDSLFLMTKAEVLHYLGNDYIIRETGPADIDYEGYWYKEYGLALVFSLADTLILIFPDSSFEINGVRHGMTLAEVQEVLGTADIKDDWYGVPAHYAFTIEYLIGKSKYSFTVPYEIDAPAMLTISWGRRRLTADYIESLFNLTKDEIITRFGEWIYGGDIAMGRKPELVEIGFNGYEGLYFSEWGFTFAFEDDDTVSFIILDESVEVNRVGSGMTFFQIQTELGETEVMMSKKGEGFEYSIEYIINGNKYRFLSNKPGGSESILVINQLVYAKGDGN